MKNTKVSKNFSRSLGTYDILLMVVLSAIIVVSPYFRGLYFREDYIPTIAIISAFFGLFLYNVYRRKNLNLLSNMIDIGMMGLVLAYGISFFNGVSPMDSLDAVLKIIGVYLIYIAAKHTFINDKIREYGYEFIVIYGFIVSFISMLGASNLFPTYEVFGFGNRLTGLYQYPNATASVFAAIYIFILVRLCLVEGKYKAYLYSIAASTLMLAFLQTKSRGGILVLGMAWFISFLLVNNKSKLTLILYTAVTAAPALLLYNQTYNSFIEKKGFLLLYALLIGMIIAMTAVLTYLKKYTGKVNDKLISYALVGVLILSIGTAWGAFQITEPLTLSNAQQSKAYELYEVEAEGDYLLHVTGVSVTNNENLNVVVNSVDKARNRTELARDRFSINDRTDIQLNFKTLKETQYIVVDLVSDNSDGKIIIEGLSLNDKLSGDKLNDVKLKYKYIPDDVAKKITEINVKTENSTERLYFVKDGTKILKDYPVFGAGGNAWGNLYMEYQSYPYKSRETHNYYMQVLLEAGIVGFIFIGIMLIGVIYMLIKRYRDKSMERNTLVALIALITVLLSHVAIDFDFSLYTIMIFTWFVIGIISGFQEPRTSVLNKVDYRKILFIALSLVTAFSIIASSVIYSGISNGRQGSSLISTDPQAAKAYLEKAVKQDPLNVLYKVDYYQIMNHEAKQTGNAEAIKVVAEQYTKLRRLDPYKVTMYQPMLGFYLENNYFKEVNEVLDTLIRLQPLNVAHYEIKAEVNQNIFDFYFEQGNIEEAKKYGEAVLQILEIHKNVNSRIITPFELTEKTKRIISEFQIMMNGL